MKKHTITILLLWLASLILAKTNPPPSWLDTIPPVVTPLPKKKYHNIPFYISFVTDENAQVWVGVNFAVKMKKYSKKITVANSGKTVVYFYAEDFYGNKSVLDSAIYVLDFQPPDLKIKPDPGIFASRVILQLKCNEPCRFYRHSDPSGKDRIDIQDTLLIDNRFKGYISAVDKAGNRTRSGELVYIVDTASVNVAIQPSPGIYSSRVKLSFKASEKADIYYTFDPNVPPKWFTLYKDSLLCPYGLSLVRYYARNKFNHESPIMNATFVVDTIPPKIRFKRLQGNICDTIVIGTKEKSVIRYSLDRTMITEENYLYRKPIIISREGNAFIRAVAKDRAGNVSKPFIWKYKYDKTVQEIKPSHASSSYTSAFVLTFETSAPVKIFYTLNGSFPDETSPVYSEGIKISKEGVTIVRFMCIDESGNKSSEGHLEYYLDISPPKVKARIKRDEDEDNFILTLIPNEHSSIYYEIGDKNPSTASPIYNEQIRLKTGEILKFFAIDSVGNISKVQTINDLKQAMVSVIPNGGVFNNSVPISFDMKTEADIYWRILPDTTFRLFKDSLVLDKEGSQVLEYYSVSPQGFRNPLRQCQFMLDWTAPRVDIYVKKGVKDSVSIFFECSENASIYYTLDGSSPLLSGTTQIIGNKYTKSKDRISVFRSSETKLAFYAEDVAGNQSFISVIDIFKPRAVPNLPSGTNRIYDRILSLSLNTYDDRSQIFYERHGATPTMNSPIYTEPLTLLHSDTISAFVVDASGYRGEIDRFIYLIDLPPSPQFKFLPENIVVDNVVTFNASETFDHESPLNTLAFLWDFDGNGIYDAKSKGSPIITYIYPEPGKYSANLEVIDPMKRKGRIKHDVLVYSICPRNMVFIPRENKNSFCIDKFEWPNKKNKIPMTNVSWIQAKMFCYDEGKRLCTEEEWQYACSGGKENTNIYPYGSKFRKGICPVDGEKIFKSGKFNNCHEEFGTYDMIGNVWEWVSDKKDSSPIMVGGTFKNSDKAHCKYSSQGSLTKGSEYTGFRCCK